MLEYLPPTAKEIVSRASKIFKSKLKKLLIINITPINRKKTLIIVSGEYVNISFMSQAGRGRVQHKTLPSCASDTVSCTLSGRTGMLGVGNNTNTWIQILNALISSWKIAVSYDRRTWNCIGEVISGQSQELNLGMMASFEFIISRALARKHYLADSIFITPSARTWMPCARGSEVQETTHPLCIFNAPVFCVNFYLDTSLSRHTVRRISSCSHYTPHQLQWSSPQHSTPSLRCFQLPQRLRPPTPTQRPPPIQINSWAREPNALAIKSKSRG